MANDLDGPSRDSYRLDFCRHCGFMTINGVCGQCERRAKTYLAAICRGLVKVVTTWAKNSGTPINIHEILRQQIPPGS